MLKGLIHKNPIYTSGGLWKQSLLILGSDCRGFWDHYWKWAIMQLWPISVFPSKSCSISSWALLKRVLSLNYSGIPLRNICNIILTAFDALLCRYTVPCSNNNHFPSGLKGWAAEKMQGLCKGKVSQEGL